MKENLGDGHVVRTQFADIIGNRCFGCGADSKSGMRLRFHVDEERQRMVCRVRVPRRFEGPPGCVHGGIIATMLDEAMGKANKLKRIVALTRKMEIEYLKLTPLATPLLIEGWPLAQDGRKHTNYAEIRNEAGEVLARSTGLFIEIDPAEVFAREVERRRKAAK